MSAIQRKLVVLTAQSWFDATRDSSYSMGERLLFMENALNHTENALVAARDEVAELTAIKDDYEDLKTANKKLNNMVAELAARAEQAEGREKALIATLGDIYSIALMETYADGYNHKERLNDIKLLANKVLAGDGNP